MKDVILLLYMQDEIYGKRLLRYLAGQKNPALHPELLTEKKEIDVRMTQEKGNVVLLTDDREAWDDKKRIIRLSERKNVAENEIFIYQKASGIYEDLIKKLEIPGEEKEAVSLENSPKGIYVIFSPDGGISTLSAAVSQYLGSFGKCLYINISGFPIYYGEQLSENPNFETKGLGELLFFVDREQFAQKEKEISIPFGTARMLAPAHHFKDISDSDAGDWEKMLMRLREDCSYDTVVIESSHLFESTLDLLELCDYPYFITKKGVCGEIKKKVFLHYLELEGKEKLSEKCIFLENICSEEENKIIESLKIEKLAKETEWMEKIKNWLSGGEEENDCVIEYDE